MPISLFSSHVLCTAWRSWDFAKRWTRL